MNAAKIGSTEHSKAFNLLLLLLLLLMLTDFYIEILDMRRELDPWKLIYGSFERTQ
jgi:hypothetical protein